MSVALSQAKIESDKMRLAVPVWEILRKYGERVGSSNSGVVLMILRTLKLIRRTAKNDRKLLGKALTIGGVPTRGGRLELTEEAKDIAHEFSRYWHGMSGPGTITSAILVFDDLVSRKDLAPDIDRLLHLFR